MERFTSLENHGRCAQSLAEDPLKKGEKFQLPPAVFHFQRYLEMLKWPVNKYASLDIKVTLFERRICNQIDKIPTVEQKFPKWSRLDTSNTVPAIAIPANTVFTVDVTKHKATVELYKKLKFSVGTDNFQPFEGMVLRLTQAVPEVLHGRLSLDNFYGTLRTERALMGQVNTQSDSVRTPEAYKEILKLVDIKGIVQRLIIKSTLVLLAQMEASDPADTPVNDLIMDWCLSFKDKLVMLFVNSFLLSAEAEFVNGEIFQQSLRINSEESWIQFANRVKSRK